MLIGTLSGSLVPESEHVLVTEGAESPQAMPVCASTGMSAGVPSRARSRGRDGRRWRGPIKKDVPYIMDLTFSKYDVEKKGEQITGYSISEINKMVGDGAVREEGREDEVHPVLDVLRAGALLLLIAMIINS